MTWTIYRPDEKKAKKSTGKLGLNFPYMTILKPSNIHLASVSEHIKKNIVEFTDSTNIIYWQAKMA